MLKDSNKDIFIHVVRYSGLIIELTSNMSLLLKLDFVEKQKENRSTGLTPPPIKKTLQFLDDYFARRESIIKIYFKRGQNEIENTKTNSLILDLSGYTEKEISVYKELIKTGPGETVSYSELALNSGISNGGRFAGNCMARNRFPVIIPCHRVIKRDGSIGSYTGGVGIKEFLLKHEAALFR